MIKCIVIDDEPLALQLMCEYVETTPTLELIKSFDNAVEAITFLRNVSVDLIFVDINMPQLSGLEFAEAISPDIKIVFITAYRDYAVEGFKLDAADYLVKPLPYATFLKSVDKILRRYFDDAQSIEHIFVRSECRSVRVTLSEILYIESRREYMDIHLSSGEVVSTISNVSAMHDKLPKGRFIKAHRSFIVNVDNISLVENHAIIFGKQRIPLSKDAREVIAKLTR